MACRISPRSLWLTAIRVSFTLVLAALAARGAAAQRPAPSFDASDLHQPAVIDCPWLMHAGDDPAYAQPGFDDSQWMVYDPRIDLTKIFTQNHPETVWYRLRVKVDPKQTGLALRESMISRAFEIYVNGERVMAGGQIAPFVPSTMNAKILARIPDRMLASGSVLIAMRVHISPMEWKAIGPGFDVGNLAIGDRETLQRDGWLTLIGDHAFVWIDHLLLMGLGLVALVLFAAQRRQTEYLWIAAMGLLTLAEFIEPLIASFYPIALHWEVLYDSLRLFTPYLWTGLYFSFIHQRMGWRWRAFLVFAGIMNAIGGMQGLYFSVPLPLQAVINLPFIILLSLVVPIMLAIHWRRGNREAGILLIPVLLFSLYIYTEIGFQTLFQISGRQELALRGLNLIDRYPVGPFALSLDNLSDILSTGSLAIIMLLRSTTMSRRQAILEGELAAAQEVQQVLLPEHTETVAGFAVETVYEPAQQVGGDFFQVLPAGEDGLLVVVGDVAGKGLPAAMLVSMLVGAVRATADHTHSPEVLLSSLNERLFGRGGFSTALAAHIAANGTVTIANAGHLSPYLDGMEVELPGALPLGVMSGARYETTQFHLAAGSRLTFYSDGVVEAQKPDGELFGFDRAREISTRPAAAIVETAKRFGQEDDITVVTIARALAVATAA
jgi:sigma-B regulation protein RsbU (phosphoserine phosphatase)